jgi:photosystem II stability/assembly factor-like uncharacterized protein
MRIRRLLSLLIAVLAVLAGEAHAQQQPPVADALKRAFTRAMFVDMSHGFVFDTGMPTGVIATDDSGSTWRLVLDLPGRGSQEGLVSAFFLDADKLWLLTVDRTGTAKLYRSGDGGHTLESQEQTFVLPRSGRKTGLDGRLFFRTELEGWCASGEALLKTTDGGTTWQSVLPPGTSVYVHEIRMFDENEGIGWDTRAVSRTTDGGRTWARVPNVQGLKQVSCTGAGFCAGLASTYGPVLVSSDRGQTWTDAQIPLTAPDQDKISAIHAVGPGNVVAVGSDIGHSYARDVEPLLNAGQPGPSFPPPRGLILKWDGSTWTRITHEEPRQFAGAYFVDVNDGWLPAYENAIYKTTDAGQTLQFVPDYFRQTAALTPSPAPVVLPTPSP